MPEFKVSAWVAMFAPKGTPKPILDKFTDALDRALDDDISRKRLLDLVNEIPEKASRGQQPLADLVKKDIARWTQIIKAAGVMTCSHEDLSRLQRGLALVEPVGRKPSGRTSSRS